MLCLFRGLRVAAASPASGLPNPLLCLVSVCEPDSVFSVSSPEGRERSRRPSLSGRRLHFVAVGHFAHFGARFPVFGAVRPYASVRDRLIISVYSSFWHTSYLLPFEGHWGLKNPLRGRVPFSVLNSHFSGPRTACFGPRAFVLHRFLFIFGRYLCFITRKVTEGWEASNCCGSQLSLLRSLPAPVFPTSRPMLNTLGTPCLPSAIPERFAGGLSCQDMTIRLIGCGLCQYGNTNPGKAKEGQTGFICSSDPTVTSHIISRPVMAQGSEKFVAMIAALNQGTVMQNKTSAETQRPSEASVSDPPSDPNDQTSPAYLNLIHILPSTYDPSIYITLAHLPKPEVFIPESMDLCMMGAPEPQSSQTREPTTSELMGMIKDLQKTVTDLASGTLAPSSTTSHTREFVSKGPPVLERAVLEECQSLGEVKASGKNKIGTDMDPHEHLLLAVEALKAKGLDKEQVLTVVAKAVDDTFATQVGSSLNQRENREKGRYTRGNPVSSNPPLGRDQRTRPAPANPFLGASSKNPQTQKYQPRGRRVFHALYMPLSKALQILVGQGHLKPLEPQPLPNPLPATHDTTQYCAYHQQTGHTTDDCFRLRHEVQDLFDNGVILPPSLAKSIGT
ncbi:hypothetical protein HYC85_029339 [Camellia sinensis]|uniref:Uncharacterized protein n=1 Tax=Camellia sinensis TaxID=4442 RepID=A0A7J7G051_CAMSI|nr:hypothetical protein HYC85_029339 [Camellia sinensis]